MFKKIEDKIISKSFVLLLIIYVMTISNTCALTNKIEKKLLDKDDISFASDVTSM